MAPHVLDVVFTYKPELAKGSGFASENKPTLRVYVSHALGGPTVRAPEKGIVYVPAEQVAAGQISVAVPFYPENYDANARWYDASVIFPSHGKHKVARREASSDRVVLPRDVSLCIDAFAQTASQVNQVCETRAGEAIFLLRDALQGQHEEEYAIQNTGTHVLVKGIFELNSVKLRGVADPDTVLAYAPDDTVAVFPEVRKSKYFDDKVQADIQAELQTRAYNGLSIYGYWTEPKDPSAVTADRTATGLALDQPVDPTLLVASESDFLSRVHCPFYKTRAGMLGGSQYMRHMPRTPPPAAFYLQMMRIALARANTTALYVSHVLDAQAKSETLLPATVFAVGLYGETLNTFSTSLVYLEDFVNSQGDTREFAGTGARLKLVDHGGFEGTEDYLSATFSDDCEGLAAHIMAVVLMFDLLKPTEIDGLECTEAERGLLKHFHRMSLENVWVPQMMLGAVSSAKMEIGQKLTADNAGAHTFGVLTPAAKFEARLDGLGHPDDLVGAVRNATFFRRSRTHRKPWHAELPVLVLEGTARAPALPLPPLSYYAEADREVAKARLKVRLTVQAQLQHALGEVNADLLRLVEFPMPPKELEMANATDPISNFYQQVQSAYVVSVAETGILDFAFAVKGAQAYPSAPFVKFVQWEDDLIVVPFNRAEPRYQAWCNAVHALIEPNPTLEYDPTVEATLRPLPDFSHGHTAARTGASHDFSTAFPLPSLAFTVSVRHADAFNSDGTETAVLPALRTAIRALKNVESVHAAVHYISELPVHGEKADLPPNVMHDIRIVCVNPAK